MATFRHDGAPLYLSNDLQYAGQRRTGMCSASAILLEVPRSRTAVGDRSFSIAGPRVQNTLSASVREINSSLRFRKLLKASLFVWRPRRRWRWTGAFKFIHSFTYLLTEMSRGLKNHHCPYIQSTVPNSVELTVAGDLRRTTATIAYWTVWFHRHHFIWSKQ